MASSFAAGWYCRRSISDATRLPRFAPSTLEQQQQQQQKCSSRGDTCTSAVVSLKRQVRDKWLALFPCCCSVAAAGHSQSQTNESESAETGAAESAAAPSGAAAREERCESVCGVSRAALPTGGIRKQQGPRYKNLVVTRRLVVPYEELKLFAPILNELAALNIRQFGFLSQTIYVRELEAAAPVSSSPLHKEAAATAKTPHSKPATAADSAAAPAAAGDSGDTAATPATHEDRIEDTRHKALEILSVEEWVDPVAAREAMRSSARKHLLDTARRNGWDLTGELWMGVGERRPEPHRPTGAMATAADACQRM